MVMERKPNLARRFLDEEESSDMYEGEPFMTNEEVEQFVHSDSDELIESNPRRNAPPTRGVPWQMLRLPGARGSERGVTAAMRDRMRSQFGVLQDFRDSPFLTMVEASTWTQYINNMDAQDAGAELNAEIAMDERASLFLFAEEWRNDPSHEQFRRRVVNHPSVSITEEIAKGQIVFDIVTGAISRQVNQPGVRHDRMLRLALDVLQSIRFRDYNYYTVNLMHGDEGAALYQEFLSRYTPLEAHEVAVISEIRAGIENRGRNYASQTTSPTADAVQTFAIMHRIVESYDLGDTMTARAGLELILSSPISYRSNMAFSVNVDPMGRSRISREGGIVMVHLNTNNSSLGSQNQGELRAISVNATDKNGNPYRLEQGARNSAPWDPGNEGVIAVDNNGRLQLRLAGGGGGGGGGNVVPELNGVVMYEVTSLADPTPIRVWQFHGDNAGRPPTRLVHFPYDAYVREGNALQVEAVRTQEQPRNAKNKRGLRNPGGARMNPGHELAVKDILIDEGGASGLKPLMKAFPKGTTEAQARNMLSEVPDVYLHPAGDYILMNPAHGVLTNVPFDATEYINERSDAWEARLEQWAKKYIDDELKRVMRDGQRGGFREGGEVGWGEDRIEVFKYTVSPSPYEEGAEEFVEILLEVKKFMEGYNTGYDPEGYAFSNALTRIEAYLAELYPPAWGVTVNYGKETKMGKTSGRPAWEARRPTNLLDGLFFVFIYPFDAIRDAYDTNPPLVPLGHGHHLFVQLIPKNRLDFDNKMKKMSKTSKGSFTVIGTPKDDLKGMDTGLGDVFGSRETIGGYTVWYAFLKGTKVKVPWMIQLPRKRGKKGALLFGKKQVTKDGKTYHTIRPKQKGNAEVNDAWKKFLSVYGEPVFKQDKNKNVLFYIPKKNQTGKFWTWLKKKQG